MHWPLAGAWQVVDPNQDSPCLSEKPFTWQAEEGVYA